MLHLVRLAAVAVVMLAVPAMAQTMIVEHAGLATAAKGDVRVNVSMGFFVAAPTDDSDAAVKAQEQARKTIYESAARECDVLRAVIASECHLESITVNVNRQYGNQIPQGFNANGNFAYRVKLK